MKNLSLTENRQVVLPVYEALTPTIYYHIENAINELGKPKILTKDDPELTNYKRILALKFWKKIRRPIGFSVDEYPFASTKEGGYSHQLF